MKNQFLKINRQFNVEGKAFDELMMDILQNKDLLNCILQQENFNLQNLKQTNECKGRRY